MLLFENKKEIIILLAFCMLILLLNIAWKYHKFINYKAEIFPHIKASLIKSEQKISKNNKIYFQNLFKSDDFNFYANSKKQIQSGIYELEISFKNVKFKQFLQGRLFTSFKNLKKLQNQQNFKDILNEKITSQHENQLLKELFSALYLATPIGKDLRFMVTNWGIAHLIAISGFHLGLIMSVFYLIFNSPYKWLQSNYFPYRNRNFDLNFVVLILAAFYLYLLDFTPSFLRSYLMAIIAFFLLVKGLKIFDFGNLFLCILIAICINPSLIFSIGFYFSCLGVFFILVYIYHFGDKKDLNSKTKILIHTLLFNFFVFFAMNIPVYYFFPQASIFQISVILLSYIFIIFYPLSIILHLLNLGGIFDEYLLKFLQFAHTNTEIFIPKSVFVLFNLALILCLKYRFVALSLSLSGCFIYFYKVFS